MPDERSDPDGVQFETLLPMIAAYQSFYEADDVQTDRNRVFFRRFLAPSDDGMLIGAWRGEWSRRIRLPLLALLLDEGRRDGPDERPLRRRDRPW